jgi:predicted small secreted protein
MGMNRPAILALVLLATAASACGTAPGGGGTVTPMGPGYTVSGYAHAGPTCPVAQDPPDPACIDRPVAGAGLLVRTAAGVVSAEVTTTADGTFTVTLPPGSYTLVPQPVEGLLGTADEQDFQVVDGPLSGVDVSYDTGIR